MARGTGAVAPQAGVLPRWPGVLAGLLVTAVVLLPVGRLALWPGEGALTAADWAAVRFTLWQAVLSAGISGLLAVPLARALARRVFRGRRALIGLMGAPFILPVVVAVFGLIALFGRNGPVNSALDWAGLPPLSIYGLHGVVIAHVFLNLPLVTRILLQGWAAIPSEHFRLAEALGAPVGRLLEAPMLRARLPGALATVFLLCLTSFAVALTLGGGPAATTVELAIYQALRFDFDPAAAARLALVQLALGAAVALALWAIAPPPMPGAGLDRPLRRRDGGHTGRWLDGALIALAAAFLIAPLALIAGGGVAGLPALPAATGAAALRSLAVALVAAGLAVALALALALVRGPLAEIAAALPLAASALVLGAGLYLLAAPWASPATLALPLTALVNAVMALPFAYRLIAPAVVQAEAAHGRLATTLGLTGAARVRLFLLPRIRPALGLAAGLAAALSMGDLGIITLFAGAEAPTLPLLMQGLMGAYRMQAAAGVALILAGLAFALYWACDRWGGSHANS